MIPSDAHPAGDGWLDEDEEDEDADAELAESTWASCPYCGELVELLLDPGGGPVQEYVEDCEVCCRPWQVRVTIDGSGSPHVLLSTLDEE